MSSAERLEYIRNYLGLNWKIIYFDLREYAIDIQYSSVT